MVTQLLTYTAEFPALLCNTKSVVACGVYSRFTSSSALIRQNITSGNVNTGEQVILMYSFFVLSLMSYTTQASTVASQCVFPQPLAMQKQNESLETPPTTELNYECATDTNAVVLTNRVNKTITHERVIQESVSICAFFKLFDISFSIFFHYQR